MLKEVECKFENVNRYLEIIKDDIVDFKLEKNINFGIKNCNNYI